MDLETKLGNIGLKNILIVDSSLENLEQAKDHFKQYKKIKFGYESDSSKALKRIEERYEKSKYDLVLTNAQMSKRKRDLKISEKAFEYQGIAGLIIDRNYDGFENSSKKPMTHLLIGNNEFIIRENRESPEFWKEVFENTSRYLLKDGKGIFNLMQKFYKQNHSSSEIVGKIFNELYKTRIETILKI